MANESKKNLVEEALLQMKNLEEAVSENAKGILASTMKEEISELVKESLTEEETEEMTETETSEMKDEMSEQEDMELDIEDDEDEMDIEMDDMDSDEELDMEDEDEGDEVDMEDMLMMDLPGDELEIDDEEEVLLPLDLTTASDEEILKVFKAMGDEDGIIVKKDNDEIHLSDTEEDVEYIIQTESEDEKMDEMKDMEEMTEMDDMDEVVYELEIDEMYEENEEEVEEMYESEVEEGYDESNEEYKEETKEASKYGKGKGDIPSRDRAHKQKGHGSGPRKKETDKEEGIKMDYTETYEEAETTEAARTYGNGERNYPKRKSLPKMKVQPNKSLRESEMSVEVESLRAKNEEYRKALNIFREKLNEVAVFNSNLAYATRLFTEHSTTKQEKINILRRFDSVESLKESKTLYKTLKEEFTGKDNTITESVQSKVQKSPSKGSATNLIESKTYENPQFMRMKDLMTKITK